MIYLYIFLGICLFVLSGMWLGSIWSDRYEGKKSSVTQYFWTVFTFVIGLLQLTYAFQTFSV
jgi:hypothetical protein